MLFREWVATGCPGTFARQRNKGKGRVERYVIRHISTPYIAEGVYEVITTRSDGLMDRDVYITSGQAICRTHGSMESEGIIYSTQNSE